MAFEKFNLTGKSALITGAAGLLGIEHASSLLESGARVILTDINKKSLERTLELLSCNFDNSKILSFVMDVSEKESIQVAFNQLKSLDIRVDILINNAAIDPKVTSIEDGLEATRFENFSLHQWNLELNVGITGAFLCSQLFGSAMAFDGKGGIILNVASDLSVFSPDQRIYRKEGLSEEQQPVKPITYSVIKTAMIGLTRYLATYWASQGIRCNALSPGGVNYQQGDVFVKRISELIPLGRMANRDEYRSAIQFLCSEASSYMTGQNIVLDGGRSTW